MTEIGDPRERADGRRALEVLADDPPLVGGVRTKERDLAAGQPAREVDAVAVAGAVFTRREDEPRPGWRSFSVATLAFNDPMFT